MHESSFLFLHVSLRISPLDFKSVDGTLNESTGL